MVSSDSVVVREDDQPDCPSLRTVLAHKRFGDNQPTDNVRRRFAFAPEGSNRLAWSMNSSLVILTSFSYVEESRCYVLRESPINIRFNSRVESITFGHASIDDVQSGLCFRPCEKYKRVLLLVVGLEDGRIKIHHGETGRLLIQLIDHKAAVRGLTFSPACALDKSILLSCSNDSTIKMWDLHDNGNMFKTLKGHDHGAFVLCCAWSPDAAWVASGGTDNTVILWKFGLHIRSNLLKLHKNFVTGCDFSPDSSKLVSCSNDTTAVIWSVSTQQPLAVLRHKVPPPQTIYSFSVNMSNVLDVAYSPDGKHIATICLDDYLRVWSLDSISRARHTRHVPHCTSLAYSTNGAFIGVSTSNDGMYVLAAPMVLSSLKSICRIATKRHVHRKQLVQILGQSCYLNMLEKGEPISVSQNCTPTFVFKELPLGKLRR